MLEEDVQQYKKWILSHTGTYYRISQNESGHIELESNDFIGYVNFYETIIVELRITRISNEETMFFLHFEYEKLEEAKQLFFDFLDTFQQLVNPSVTHVLLSCSSALTTNYFCSLANEISKGKIQFEAKDIQKCIHEECDYDCILIAPQVGYALNDVKSAHPDILVNVIPAKIFGSYDANGLINYVNEQIQQFQLTHTSHLQRFDMYYHDPRKLLIISVLNNNDDVTFLYRIYQSGNIVYENKREHLDLTIEILKGIIDEATAAHENIDCIGISCPGVVIDGTLRYEAMNFNGDEVVQVLEDKYDIPVYIFNDANMVVTGLYWTSSTYHSLVFFFQTEGMTGNGTGIVVNGHLLQGFHNFAGETKYVKTWLEDYVPSLSEYEQIIQNLIMYISTISPEAIYFNHPWLKDTEKVKQDIAKYIPEYFIPDLHYIEDISESMMIGTFLRTLWTVLEAPK